MQGVQDISWEAYLGAPGVNKSSLDWIAPPFTPSHFHARFIANTIADEETPAKRLGQLTHRVILQPDTLKDAFYIEPEDLRLEVTRIAKLKSAKVKQQAGADGMVTVEWNPSFKEAEDWAAAHADRPILTRREAKQIEAMRDAVWRHPLAKRLLAGGEMERSLFATDYDGVLRKARLDALTVGNLLPDLKTVQGTDDHWFEKQNSACRWYVQAAYSIDLCKLLGIEKVDFIYICVEKTPPFDVVCRSAADADIIRPGRMCYRRDLALLKDCRARNRWPGRSEDYLPATLPAWEMKQLDQI